MNLDALSKNKYVLYAVLALAVINIVGYVAVGSMECLGVFAVTAFVCYQYQKNIAICLLAAMFVANFLIGCGKVKENFTSSEKNCAALTEETCEKDSDGKCKWSPETKDAAAKCIIATAGSDPVALQKGIDALAKTI